MSDNRSGAGETLFVLMVGAAVGAAAGLLLAPHKGAETRRRLRRWVEDVEEGLREEGMGEFLDKGKEIVREQAQAVRNKVESVVRGKADAVKGKVDAVIKEALGDRDDDGERDRA